MSRAILFASERTWELGPSVHRDASEAAGMADNDYKCPRVGPKHVASQAEQPDHGPRNGDQIILNAAKVQTSAVVADFEYVTLGQSDRSASAAICRDRSSR